MKGASLEATEVMDGQKAQTDTKKHGGGMMLVTVLARSENYGRKGNREP